MANFHPDQLDNAFWPEPLMQTIATSTHTQAISSNSGCRNGHHNDDEEGEVEEGEVEEGGVEEGDDEEGDEQEGVERKSDEEEDDDGRWTEAMRWREYWKGESLMYCM
jgi:hypothetical protein